MRLIIVFSFCIYWIGYAQPLSDTTHLLKDVEVYASRQKNTLKEVPKNIQVISAEQIQSAAARSVAEILMLAPSLDVRSRGPFGMQTDVGIRGGTFDQSLIMIDGIKMLDPQTGHHAMNLGINPIDIERIEIIPGGASRVFGQGAFAGAINIVTKSVGNHNTGLADFALGQHGLVNSAVSKSLVLKNGFKLYASVSGLRHDGYIENTDASSYSVHVKASKEAKNQILSFWISGNLRRFGAQNFYSVIYPFQHEYTRLFSGAFYYQKRGDLWTHSFTASYREHHDRFELFREGKRFFSRTSENYFISSSGDTAKFLNNSFYRGHNYHLTRTAVGDWNSTLDMGFFGYLNIGYELRSEFIWSNRLGFTLDNPVKMPFEKDVLLSKFFDRINNAFILDHQLPITSKWSLNYGVWWNFNSDFGRATMSGVELLYRPSGHTSAWTSYNKGFRVPTFTDLFYNVGGAVGSIYLQPEVSHNYEIGIRKTQPRWQSSLSVYFRDARRLIDWVRYPDSAVVTAANITNIGFYGVDGYFTYILSPNGLRVKWIQASVAWNEYRRFFRDFSSLYALDLLKHKFSVNVLQALMQNLSVNYQVQYLSRLGTFQNTVNQSVSYPPVLLVNLRASYRINNTDVYAEGSNLLNSLHMDRGNIVLPGRWLRIGISHSF